MSTSGSTGIAPGALYEKHWYAIYTRPRHEKRVKRFLEEKRVETFLPLTNEISRWADRRVTVTRPLFAGYLFANYSHALDTHSILATEGVVRIVGAGGTPLPVADEEIGTLRLLLDSRHPFNPHPYLKAGQRVRVISGPLNGITGFVQKRKNKSRIIISVELIQRALVVEVGALDIELTPER
jgi:transcription antitermination factor NusG